jgi:hypothetical protein
MSDRANTSTRPSAAVTPACYPPLLGKEGELYSVRIIIDARHLEDLLDCLASVDFPINPHIIHGKPTSVAFPVYQPRLREIRETLLRHGFADVPVFESRMAEAITAG